MKLVVYLCCVVWAVVDLGSEGSQGTTDSYSCNVSYVILNRMARDILAIPLSTVASESAFSTGGRTLDPFRSSLTPKMVQALLCTQDWLRAKEVPIVDVEENLKELEEIEKEVQRGESNDVDDEVVFVDSLV
uniref:HAT C-terminal dimerisation domain-containing protein n=1 Tax=Chenopodium quinoa TaxID=63459 RepID=A0A803MTW6_CHEQI